MFRELAHTSYSIMAGGRCSSHSSLNQVLYIYAHTHICVCVCVYIVSYLNFTYVSMKVLCCTYVSLSVR